MLRSTHPPKRLRRIAWAIGLGLAACGPAGVVVPSWPPLAKQWFERARASYHVVDIDDASVAIESALRLQPQREEVRLLGAEVALAELRFDESIRLLDGIQSSEAGSVRGRALWYAGRVEEAADELEKLTADPEVRDPWAREASKLARRGAGRKPFEMTGGLLASVEMPRLPNAALVVPLELDGEPALALIATGSAEVVVDSASTTDPTWVSLRFGERVEVRNVPALRQDLSGLSRQMDAPIRLLLGVNLLRHLNATFDYRGSQFVVRSFEPPPPPLATTVRLSWVRGGGMVVRGFLGPDASSPQVSLLVDTTMQFPLALDDGGWKKSGIDPTKLEAVPNVRGMHHGNLPSLRLGAFEIPSVPSVHGVPVEQIEKSLEVDLDGLAGAGLLAAFRVTIFDQGRALWLEDFPGGPTTSPTATVQ